MINLAKAAPLESGIQNKDLTVGILWEQLVFTACLLLFLSEKSHSLLTLFGIEIVFGNNLNQRVFFLTLAGCATCFSYTVLIAIV